MHKKFTFTPRLKLVLDNLRAVRELHKYVDERGMEKDIRGLANELRQELNRHVLAPADWEELDYQKGVLYSVPRANKWRVVRGDSLALEVYLAWPVGDDDDPYVNLYVPPNWKKRRQFVVKLKPPQGFGHVNQYSEGEWEEHISVFKSIRYQDYLNGGVFDGDGFVKAIQGAAESLVRIEKDIDGILQRLG